MKKYLLITIHDRDFNYGCLENTCVQIFDAMSLCGFSEKTFDLETFKSIVAKMMAINKINYEFMKNQRILLSFEKSLYDYFFNRLQIKIISENEIDRDQNGEVYYIPINGEESDYVQWW